MVPLFLDICLVCGLGLDIFAILSGAGQLRQHFRQAVVVIPSKPEPEEFWQFNQMAKNYLAGFQNISV